MARLYRRKPGGPWWYQFKGRRASTGLLDREAAERAFADVQRRSADPTYRPPNETTLRAALNAFEAQQAERGRAAGTLRMYKAHVGHLARVLGEHSPLAQLAAPEWDRFFSVRHGEGASPETRWKELCTLRGVLRLARRHGSYPHPLDVVLPVIDHPYEPLKRHPTLAQVRALCAALPAKRAAIVAFVVAFAADWRCVELAEPGDVTERDALVRGSKTKHRHRRIPVEPEFRAFAAMARKAIPFEPWGNVIRDIRTACEALGIPRFTPRDLRRTHGRTLRARGVAPHLIGKMLGHADSTMAERVYAPLEPAELAKLMRGTPKRRPRRGTPKGHTKRKGPKKAA